ncbi:MAG: ABC transporter permease [Elusimicrobia bacterium]|nr:ABC transporter permease [Elusimicrobiota bacterium]
MRKAAILAWNSWQENLRGRYFTLAFFFGLVVLYMSVILGVLAADQEVRVLLDFGLGFIELMGLAGALYGATTTILREMETKTIYLILSRPVTRGEYLVGRFAGTMLSVLVSMLAMAAMHLALLFFKGWSWQAWYFWAFLGAFLKVFVTAALATFLAIFSSSVLTALTISAILWTLGHFVGEIRFMSAWGSSKAASVPLTAAAYLMPNLELLNARDRLSAPPLGLWLGYCAAYAAVWLALARQLLRRKEF